MRLLPRPLACAALAVILVGVVAGRRRRHTAIVAPRSPVETVLARVADEVIIIPLAAEEVIPIVATLETVRTLLTEHIVGSAAALDEVWIVTTLNEVVVVETRQWRIDPSTALYVVTTGPTEDDIGARVAGDRVGAVGSTDDVVAAVSVDRVAPAT